MQGLFGKYLISKRDGSPLDPSALYFVIRYDYSASHGVIGRKSILAYIKAIRDMRQTDLYPLALDLGKDLMQSYPEECSDRIKLEDILKDIQCLS